MKSQVLFQLNLRTTEADQIMSDGKIARS